MSPTTEKSALNYAGANAPDRTSRTDDERIRNIVPLPPPEHLIRFFPIQGTPVEGLISRSRKAVKDILHGRSDRLLVIIGPCSMFGTRQKYEPADIAPR